MLSGTVRLLAYGATVLLLGVLATAFFLLPPFGFPAGAPISLTEGASVAELSRELEASRVVRSAVAFELLSRVSGAERTLNAGVYVFEHPLSLPSVLARIAAGEHGLGEVSVTFPEGMTVREMAYIVAERFPGITPEEFVRAAQGREGYLFPDTYRFPRVTTAEDIVARMNREADAVWAEEFAPSANRTREEAITMASILEKETKDDESRAIVAGILWKRIEIGMALQVDAVFGYIRGEPTFHPSLSDLEEDSPYNTYRNRGLPPGPIGNPGRSAIKAALKPTSTPYLYYLTGLDGTMRYAKTFEGHKENRARYR